MLNLPMLAIITYVLLMIWIAILTAVRRKSEVRSRMYKKIEDKESKIALMQLEMEEELEGMANYIASMHAEMQQMRDPSMVNVKSDEAFDREALLIKENARLRERLRIQEDMYKTRVALLQAADEQKHHGEDYQGEKVVDLLEEKAARIKKKVKVERASVPIIADETEEAVAETMQDEPMSIRVRRMLNDGKTVAQIAKALGCSTMEVVLLKSHPEMQG